MSRPKETVPWRFDTRLLVLALVWLGAALYLTHFVERGWIPHDEGALAHSAERVLRGELPHRDFDEIYTGGLSYLHALAFEVLGVRLTSIRWVLYVFTLLFVPALFGIAARIVPPVVAGVVTLLAVAWSLPNYFAAIPSWYNLFFATFGTWALLRHMEGDGRGWLVLAGACGGLSMLAKIAGLYFVAAGFLFLLQRELELARATAAPDARPTPSLQALKALTALACIGGLVRIVWTRLGAMELVIFVLPGAAVALFLVWSELRDGRGAGAARFRTLVGLVAPFAAGVAIPILLFLVPYVAAGAVGDLMRGVFILPARRIDSASMALPPVVSLLAVLPFAGVLALPMLAPTVERGLAAVLAVALAALVLSAGTNPPLYKAVWYSVRPLTPFVALAGCWVLARPAGRGDRDAERRQILFLLVAVASMVSLVQFPYSFGIYFCYAAPLVALAAVAVVRARATSVWPPVAVLGFYLTFACMWLNTGYVRGIDVRWIRDEQSDRLDIPRGGLRVYDPHIYEQLVALVARQARSEYIYAGPDAPEIYFLTGRRNPTRVIFDIFDDPVGRSARILERIDTHAIDVVVINGRPEFSPKVDDELAAGLRARFPRWGTFGRYQVGWRE